MKTNLWEPNTRKERFAKLKEYDDLQRGDIVKVRDNFDAFWVRVGAVIDGGVIGFVDNENVTNWAYDERIDFSKYNIIDRWED
jgi:hypothetical protein